MESESSKKLKIVISGPPNTGKTYLASLLCFKNISFEYIPTIGVEFYTTIIEKTIKLYIWDVSGQQRFSKITDNFIKLGNMILYTYNILDQNSFDLMKDIFYHHRKNILTNKNTKYIIVGTHFDKYDEQQVNIEDVNNFLDDNNLLHCRISSISYHNIYPLRQRIIHLLTKDE